MFMTKNIIKAIDSCQKAQRNYDLSKSIPESDLRTLIYAAKNSPSKQNETHYQLCVYTDNAIISQIYNHTKKFTLGINEALEKGKGEEWLYENKSVKNSQIYANTLFVYLEDEGDARGATHLRAQSGHGFEQSVLTEQKNYSIGISVGELILSASLLGYKTGICSAMDVEPIRQIIKTQKEPKLLVGIGYENEDRDRTEHAETLNKHVPENFKTGSDSEYWKFPTFQKKCAVYLNGQKIKDDN